MHSVDYKCGDRDSVLPVLNLADHQINLRSAPISKEELLKIKCVRDRQSVCFKN